MTLTRTMPSISDLDSVSETKGKRNMQLMFMNNTSIKYVVSFKSGSWLLNAELFSYWREIYILKGFETRGYRRGGPLYPVQMGRYKLATLRAPPSSQLL